MTKDQNTRLKRYISCLKCQVRGEVCDDNCPIQYEAGNMGEIIKNLEEISKFIDEYIGREPKRNRIVITFKDEKENIMLFNAKLTIDGNIASVEGNATRSPHAHYMIFHFRMSSVKHIKEVLFDEI